jgi:hypothetical protein
MGDGLSSPLCVAVPADELALLGGQGKGEGLARGLGPLDAFKAF